MGTRSPNDWETLSGREKNPRWMVRVNMLEPVASYASRLRVAALMAASAAFSVSRNPRGPIRYALLTVPNRFAPAVVISSGFFPKFLPRTSEYQSEREFRPSSSASAAATIPFCHLVARFTHVFGV